MWRICENRSLEDKKNAALPVCLPQIAFGPVLGLNPRFRGARRVTTGLATSNVRRRVCLMLVHDDGSRVSCRNALLV